MSLSIKHEPDDLVHTHSITSGESTINPAACNVVSARGCTLLYSANMYKDSHLEVLCFYRHRAELSEGLEVSATCSAPYPILQLRLYAGVSVGVFLFLFLYRIQKSKIESERPPLTLNSN